MSKFLDIEAAEEPNHGKTIGVESTDLDDAYDLSDSFINNDEELSEHHTSSDEDEQIVRKKRKRKIARRAERKKKKIVIEDDDADSERTALRERCKEIMSALETEVKGVDHFSQLEAVSLLVSNDFGEACGEHLKSIIENIVDASEEFQALQPQLECLFERGNSLFSPSNICY